VSKLGPIEIKKIVIPFEFAYEKPEKSRKDTPTAEKLSFRQNPFHKVTRGDFFAKTFPHSAEMNYFIVNWRRNRDW